MAILSLTAAANLIFFMPRAVSAREARGRLADTEEMVGSSGKPKAPLKGQRPGFVHVTSMKEMPMHQSAQRSLKIQVHFALWRRTLSFSQTGQWLA